MSYCKKTRERGPNFSSNEKEILISLISKHKDVVENKKSDAVTTAAKNEGWRTLTEEFNSLSNFANRNADQLKTCWDNIKRNIRKNKAYTKNEIFLTGGGQPKHPPPAPFQDQVEGMLGPTLDGLPNDFDGDAYFEQPNTDVEVVTLSQCTPFPIVPAAGSLDNELAGPSLVANDIVTVVIEENSELASQSQDDAEKPKPWSSWSPAVLKTKVSQPLKTPNSGEKHSWIRRRRPKASLHDELLNSKLELLELLKKNAATEAEKKNILMEEQIKQEKIRTEILQLELKNLQNSVT